MHGETKYIEKEVWNYPFKHISFSCVVFASVFESSYSATFIE